MSRIKFPLDGIKFDSGEEMKWSKNNWTMLKTRIFDVDTTEFKIEFKKNNDSFYQKFWIENSGFWGEYKFRLLQILFNVLKGPHKIKSTSIPAPPVVV